MKKNDELNAVMFAPAEWPGHINTFGPRESKYSKFFRIVDQLKIGETVKFGPFDGSTKKQLDLLRTNILQWLRNQSGGRCGRSTVRWEPGANGDLGGGLWVYIQVMRHEDADTECIVIDARKQY